MFQPVAALPHCASSDAPLFDDAAFHAVIVPNKSLSDKALRIVVGLVTAVASAIGLVACIGGFWPIAVVMAIDALLLIGVLIAGRRKLDREEHVVMTRTDMIVMRFDRGRVGSRETLPLWGVYLDAHQDPDYGCLSLSLRRGRRQIEVARDLSPAERREFGLALLAALATAGGAPRIETTQAQPLAA